MLITALTHAGRYGSNFLGVYIMNASITTNTIKSAESEALAVEVNETTSREVAQLASSLAINRVVLTRSQKKALDYALRLQAEGRVGDLSLSSVKTDQLVFARLNTMLNKQNAVVSARADNNKIHALILNVLGSNAKPGIYTPKSAKTIELKLFYASLVSYVHGKDDSTEKARDARQAYIDNNFAEIKVLISELRD